MAAMHEEEVPEAVECANCGATQGLLKCSRCHTSWFCSVKCQKAYWPFHRTQCRRNEFADAVEEQEPRFASWMRRHGKLAVLKDDEVDRLERASAAASGPGRQEVMESMYGRLEPKPAAPAYSAEELAAMRRADEAGKAAARAALAGCGGPPYAALELPAELGLDCGRYKWRQSQSHVEVFVPLPPGLPAGRVDVRLTTTSLSIIIDEAPVLCGRLYRAVKAGESTWYCCDGVLELVLAKRSRRGAYEAGATNADTFWRAVVHGVAPSERLLLEDQPPPTCYYSAPCEGLEKEQRRPLRLASGRGKQAGPAEAAAPALTAA